MYSRLMKKKNSQFKGELCSGLVLRNSWGTRMRNCPQENFSCSQSHFFSTKTVVCPQENPGGCRILSSGTSMKVDDCPQEKLLCSQSHFSSMKMRDCPQEIRSREVIKIKTVLRTTRNRFT